MRPSAVLLAFSLVNLAQASPPFEVDDSPLCVPENEPCGTHDARKDFLSCCMGLQCYEETACIKVDAMPLPRLSIDPKEISISGLSSGADFTVQFQVAFSSILKGSGVFAGQVYHCAVTRFPNEPLVNASTEPRVPLCEGCPPGYTLTYDHCKNVAIKDVNVSALIDYASTQATQGHIDSLEGLRHARIYLYRGTKDACYEPGSVDLVHDFFSKLVKDPTAQILFNRTTPSAHSWPTVDYGTPCGEGVIEACGYDGPGSALQHIYGLLRPPATAYDPSSLYEFDQGPFQGSPWTHTGLNASGLIYIPKGCEAAGAKCKLHLSMHGCGVNGYYEPASRHLFNRWAEANLIVVVYPRMADHGDTKETESGCWDSYGQMGEDYATRTGVQMAAVRRMISAISGIA